MTQAQSTSGSGRYVMAVDAGTGGTRALIFDDHGSQLAVSYREWVHHEPPDAPGGQDFDTATNWPLIAECIHEALSRADLTGDDIAAVSTTSMREGIVLFDKDKVEIWACPNVDGRAGVEALELDAEGKAQTIYDIGGDWVSITTPPRLRWIAKHRPDVWGRIAHLCLLSDWISFRLSGVIATEPSCGSSSGMFDLSTRTWSPEIVEICNLSRDVLPDVVDPGTVIGTVQATAAAQTGLREGTPVVAGGADTQIALVGAGIDLNACTVIAGTFWQTTALVDNALIDPDVRLRTLCHLKPGQWMIEGIGFYSGFAMRWMRDAFCQPEIQQARSEGVDPYTLMENLAATIPAGSNGVLAILSNVMNSKRWVHAAPSLVGFNLADPHGSGRAAAIRAVEEAAAYVARAHLDIIREVSGLSVDTITFTGGSAKGELWPQIIADALNVQVNVPRITESSALGAAMCAMVGAGFYPSLDEVPVDKAYAKQLSPDPAAAEAYTGFYERWQRTYREMQEITERGPLMPMAGVSLMPNWKA